VVLVAVGDDRCGTGEDGQERQAGENGLERRWAPMRRENMEEPRT
jgi:hypothetical protein